MRKHFLSAIAAVGLLSGAAGVAKADPIREIALLIDSSASISAGDFALQQNGYISALSSLLNPDGLNAIGVWQFSTDAGLTTSIIDPVFPLTTIASASDKTSLLSAIAGMVQIGNDTPVGDAIDVAAGDLVAFLPGVDAMKIIDVSTDGLSNFGVDPATAAANAILAGVDEVNCIGIGGSADCSFIAGAGSFSLSASSFADFAAAINAKLARELRVPEPMTLAILGFGLIGLGALRRRG